MNPTVVIIARWVALPDKAADVAHWLEHAVNAARQEPGCLRYQVHRGLDNANLFVLYEEYVDAAAHQAHISSTAFQQIVLGQIVPLLAERQVDRLQAE